MYTKVYYSDFVPQIVPYNMSGTIRHRIRMTSHKKKDGTSPLYLELFQNPKRIRIPLGLSVPVSKFDKKAQRVRPSFEKYKDYNLVIEKKLADINNVEVNYKLSNKHLTLAALLDEIENPGLRMNYNAFALEALKQEKQYLNPSTYKQQLGSLSKIKKFRDPLLFSDINETLVKDFVVYMKNTLGNKKTTINGTLKNFKKYLHIANDKGIRTDLKHSDIKSGNMRGEMVFLLPEEIKTWYEFYKAPINNTWKNILQRYLFSCFTGLRISDIEKIGPDNFIGDFLVFNSVKSKKLIRIKLNETAKSLVQMPEVFNGSYSRKHINEELKKIASATGLKKKISFHTSRHTFATNFLICGGNVVNLQELLGHSKIETTMVYVHTVESVMNNEIVSMDDILK